MKLPQMIVLGVALIAGFFAFRLVLSGGSSEPVVVEQQVQQDIEKVLVAKKDVGFGEKLKSSDLVWTDWPKEAIPAGAVVQRGNSKKKGELEGRVARVPIFKGEPIRPERLINSDKGFLATILPKGKRAIAVGVEAETTAGGFILPGDKVDVILTVRTDAGAKSDTILENIKVLAIDATTAGEQDKKNLSPKRTATLELTLVQSEIVAQSQQIGTIALALRSAEDSADDAVVEEKRPEAVRFVKYGISSQPGGE